MIRADAARPAPQPQERDLAEGVQLDAVDAHPP